MFSKPVYHFCCFSLHRLQFICLFRYRQIGDNAEKTRKLKLLRLKLCLFYPWLLDEIRKNSSAFHVGEEKCDM